MSNNTGIEWTDSTWNPIRGCTPVSPGCKNCYAAKIAKRFSGPGQPYAGLVRISAAGERTDDWNGGIRFVEEHLLDPLRWGAVFTGLRLGEGIVRQKGHRDGSVTVTRERSRRIFVNSMSDLFHENVTDEMIDRIFAVMALCPQHTFQILTKRPERMLAWFNLKRDIGMSKASVLTTAWHVWSKVPDIQNLVRRETCCPFMWDQTAPDADAILGWPLPNVRLGVSVENQKAADDRLDYLCHADSLGWKTMVSFEPLLGAVDPGEWWLSLGARTWAIVGGESGPGARPMHPDWARGLRDQCVAAGVPFFFKQWGEWIETDGPHCRAIDQSRSTLSQIWMTPDGKVDARFTVLDHMHSAYRDSVLRKVGKKAAGSLLDGREWKEFPRG